METVSKIILVDIDESGSGVSFPLITFEKPGELPDFRTPRKKRVPLVPQQSREVKGTGELLAKPMQGQNDGLNIYRVKSLLGVHNCRQAVSKPKAVDQVPMRRCRWRREFAVHDRMLQICQQVSPVLKRRQ